MDFLDEHENEFGKVHRAFEKVLSEKQQVKAKNTLLKRDNAKLEREIQQGPGLARQEVMVELTVQVQSLTRENKLLKHQNKCTDDQQDKQHLPSEKQQRSREDPFVKLLERYLTKESQQAPIALYEADGARRLHPKTSIHQRFSAPPRLSDVPTANNVTEVVAAGPLPHVANSSHTSSVRNNCGNI